LSPQRQKEKTHEALVAWLCEEGREQALTYAWEDLHWADPSTLELLTLLLAQVPTTPLLAVLTFRPEFVPPWGSHSFLSQLTLSRLGRAQVEMMADRVSGGKPLPKEVAQQIASKTDGVPLFVEDQDGGGIGPNLSGQARSSSASPEPSDAAQPPVSVLVLILLGLGTLRNRRVCRGDRDTEGSTQPEPQFSACPAQPG
jgi:hypothetical protein